MMETATENRTDTVKRQRWGWLLFVVILAGLGFLFAQVHGVKEDSDKVSLAVAAERLDIGEQWETKEFRWTLPIKNTTANNIHVAKFLSECPCMTFDPPSLTVSPGQEVEVRITCDMTAKCGQNRDLPIRDYAMPIAPADAKGEALQRPWVLYGKVRSAVQLTPRAVSFGDDLMLGERSPNRVVRIVPVARVANLEVEADANLEAIIRKTSTNYELHLSGKPLLPGRWNPSVKLIARDASGSQIGTMAVPVEGVVRTPVRPEPDDHHFGIVPAGTPLQLGINLRSLNGKNYSVLSSCVEGKGLAVMPAGLQGQYLAIWQLSGSGEQTAKVSFDIQQEGLPRFTAVARLAAYAMEAKPAVE